MKHILLYCWLAILFGHVAFAQNDAEDSGTSNGIKTITVNLKDKAITGPVISRTVAVPFHKPEPFLGFSPTLEGQNVRNVYLKFKVRTSENGNNWSGWIELPHDNDLAAGPHKFIGRLQFFDASTRFIQYVIDLPAVIPSNVSFAVLRLNFISPDIVAPDSSASQSLGRNGGGPRGSHLCPLPGYVSRTGWGCPDGQNPSCNPPGYTTVTHLFVHHSAGSNNPANWASVVLSYWYYHTNNQWCDIAYNWLIDGNGVLYEGRGGGNNVRGGHLCGINSNTLGVCVMGNFQTVNPTTAAVSKLVELLAWKSGDSNINPLTSSYHPPSGANFAHISGHRDGCPTACPGNLLYAQLPQIRIDVNNFMNNGCSGNACPTTLAVSGNISSGTHVYKAVSTLNANNDVTGGNVTYKAGTLVRLTTGFKVLPGSIFKADLTGCN